MKSLRTPSNDDNLTRWQAMVFRGQTAQVAEELKSLNLRRVPRADKAPIATVARRVDLPELALRLLHEHVYPKVRGVDKPTSAELTAYAAALVRVGAVREAHTLLNLVDEREFPEAALYRAHASFAQWNYSDAIEPLRFFLRQPSLTRQQRLVGQLNLAAVLSFEEKFAEGRRVLDEAIRIATEDDLPRFLGNAWELSAQMWLKQGEWAGARDALARANVQLRGTDTIDSLFVRKWEAVTSLREAGPQAAPLAALAEVRAEAVQRRHWESVRDCDYHRACATKDDALAAHLYFGTPFPYFRKRLFRDWRGPLTIPKNYVWEINPAAPARNVIAFTEIVGPDSRRWTQPEKLVVFLFSDFYREFRVGELHAELHPEEHFNPLSSPLRVYKMVEAARKVLARAGDLEIEAVGTGYRLTSPTGARVNLPPLEELSRRGSTLEILQARFGHDQYFSAAQAAQILNLAARQAARELRNLLERSELETVGRGRATTYRTLAKK